MISINKAFANKSTTLQKAAALTNHRAIVSQPCMQYSLFNNKFMKNLNEIKSDKLKDGSLWKKSSMHANLTYVIHN